MTKSHADAKPPRPKVLSVRNVVAGVSVGAYLIPQAMAYASLAGVPVQAGLYTALLTLPLYALLGASRVLSVSTTSTLALLTASALASVAPANDPAAYAGAAAALTVCVGLILILAGALRLGFLTNFISVPIMVGFKAGMGLMIASSQLAKLLGVPSGGGGFLQNIVSAVAQLGEANRATVLMSLVTILPLFVLQRRVPRVPAALVGVALGIGAAAAFGLDARGVELIPSIPAGLPRLALPDVQLLKQLIVPALGIALMSSIESAAAARSFARRQDPHIDSSRELVALGAANVGAGLFQGMPGGGGTSQTAVNAQASAQTQVSGLVTAGAVALALTLLAPLFDLMPEATLGAVVFVAAIGLVQVERFRGIAAVRRRDAVLAVVALVSVLFIGALQGIFVSVILSLTALLYEANHPQVYVLGRKRGTNDFRVLEHHPDDETFPGLLIVRVMGRVYFANADRIADHILRVVDRSSEPVRVLLLDASGIPDMEYSALETLAAFKRQLDQRGVTLWIAGLASTPREMLRKRLLDPQLEKQGFPSVEDAVAGYVQQINPEQTADET